MKKIINILLIALCACMAGCSSDDDVITERLKVVQSDINFNALGGTGRIDLESVEPISATSSADWCTVSVSGQSVILTVDKNYTIEGRTVMIVITSGNEVTKVPVSQIGETFSTNLMNYTFSDKGGSKSFDLKFTHECIIEGNPDWLTYVLGNEVITFTVAESHVNRVAAFTLISGHNRLKFQMGQVVSIAGDYDVYYKNDNGNMTKGEAEVQDVDGNCVVKISDVVINTALAATYTNSEFTFAFPQYLGRIPPYEVYLCAYSPGTLSWTNNLRYKAKTDYDENGKLMFRFSDYDKTWAGKEMTGFYFGAFSGKIEAGGAYKGGYGTAESIVMIQK